MNYTTKKSSTFSKWALSTKKQTFQQVLKFVKIISVCLTKLKTIIMSENANLDGAGAPQGNGMATASLILGICSIVLFWLSFIGIVCGVLAIIFAVVAKNKIKANPNTAGAGSAKAGLITGIIGIAIWLVMVIVVAVFLTSAVGVFEEAIQNSNDLQDALNELENYN